jgi:hypothetical protein
MKTKLSILIILILMGVINSQGQTALEKALTTMHVSMNLPSYLSVSQNEELIYPVSEGELPTLAQLYGGAPSSGNTLIKKMFGLIHSIMTYQDGECEILVYAAGENTMRFGKMVKDNPKLFGAGNNLTYNRIRFDFRNGDGTVGPNEKSDEEVDKLLTHYPKEQAQKMFNADWMVGYPKSLMGNTYKEKFNHCQSVVIAKNGLDIMFYFMLTDKSSENFNKYLDDLNRVFWFNDIE